MDDFVGTPPKGIAEKKKFGGRKFHQSDLAQMRRNQRTNREEKQVGQKLIAADKNSCSDEYTREDQTANHTRNRNRRCQNKENEKSDQSRRKKNSVKGPFPRDDVHSSYFPRMCLLNVSQSTKLLFCARI